MGKPRWQVAAITFQPRHRRASHSSWQRKAPRSSSTSLGSSVSGEGWIQRQPQQVVNDIKKAVVRRSRTPTTSPRSKAGENLVQAASIRSGDSTFWSTAPASCVIA